MLAIAPYQILAYRERLYVRCRMEKARVEPDKFYDPRLGLHRMSSVAVTDRQFRTIAVEPGTADGNAFGLSRGELFRGCVYRGGVEVILERENLHKILWGTSPRTPITPKPQIQDM